MHARDEIPLAWSYTNRTSSGIVTLFSSSYVGSVSVMTPPTGVGKSSGERMRGTTWVCSPTIPAVTMLMAHSDTDFAQI